jgi:hypothetical protein
LDSAKAMPFMLEFIPALQVDAPSGVVFFSRSQQILLVGAFWACCQPTARPGNALLYTLSNGLSSAR